MPSKHTVQAATLNPKPPRCLARSKPSQYSKSTCRSQCTIDRAAKNKYKHHAGQRPCQSPRNTKRWIWTKEAGRNQYQQHIEAINDKASLALPQRCDNPCCSEVPLQIYWPYSQCSFQGSCQTWSLSALSPCVHELVFVACENEEDDEADFMWPGQVQSFLITCHAEMVSNVMVTNYLIGSTYFTQLGHS